MRAILILLRLMLKILNLSDLPGFIIRKFRNQKLYGVSKSPHNFFNKETGLRKIQDLQQCIENELEF